MPDENSEVTQMRIRLKNISSYDSVLTREQQWLYTALREKQLVKYKILKWKQNVRLEIIP